MQGCCQQLPPAQEQWKTLANLWSPGASLQHKLACSLLCITFKAWLPTQLGSPSREQWGAAPSCHSGTPRSAPQLTPLLEHTILRETGESSEQLCNLSLFFITFSELLQAVLMWFCILHFTTDSSICFNNSHFLNTSAGILQPAISPLQIQMHTHIPHEQPQSSLPSRGSFQKGLTQTDGTRTLLRRTALLCSPCTDTHQTCPQPETYRVTFLMGWWVKSAPESLC